MKNGKYNSMILTFLFVAGILISGYFLLRLKTDLSLSAGVLSATEIPQAMPVILRLQAGVFITFVFGLLGFYFIQRNHQRELVYIEKEREEKKSSGEKTGEGETSVESALIEEVKKILTTEKEKPVEKAFHVLCNGQEAVAGALYQAIDGKSNTLELSVPFALSFGESSRPVYEIGEGFVGQAAKDGKALYVDHIPENSHKALSGLGHSSPSFLSFIPLRADDKVIGVCEVGTFRKLDESDRITLEKACEAIAVHIRPVDNGKSKKPAKS